MTSVMAVTFVEHGRLHYLDPDGGTYRVGDRVLYPTESGPEVAQVVWAPERVDAENLSDLPRCLGHAGPDDLARDEQNRQRRAQAELVAKELIADHGLPMKVVGIDYVDRSRDYDQQVCIYFTAPHRVDFRSLLVDLARALSARIDLRQVAARDAARLTSGIGSCGRELCCTSFLTDFEPVSVRLARMQNLPTNPLQISGACGKLMCCLAYEHPLYVDFARRAPAIGSRVGSPAGEGVVVGHNVPGQTVAVRTPDGEVTRCPLESVCPTSAARRQRSAELGRDRS